MFTINQSDMPVLPTTQALLILDLQNDLVSPGATLPVDQPESLVSNIIKLAEEFRKNGKVIWIRSQFEENRPVNDESPNSECVITNAEVENGAMMNGSGYKRKQSKHLQNLIKRVEAELKAESDDVEEAGSDKAEEPHQRTEDEQELFLTVIQGTNPTILLPLTPGTNYCAEAVPFFNSTNDVFFAKSHYSAFKTGGLIQSLRGQFVTELYICGALSNISCFATAMDAARFGFQINLVSDCLGYRDQARHDEALRQLEEATGCDTLSSAEIIEARRRKRGNQGHSRPSSRRNENSGRDTRSLRQFLGGVKYGYRPSYKSSEASSSRPGTSSSRSLSEGFGIEAGSESSSQRSYSSSRRQTPATNTSAPKSEIEVDNEFKISSAPSAPKDQSASTVATTRPREASIAFDVDDAQGAHESSEAILEADDDDAYDLPIVLPKYERAIRVPGRIKVRSRSSRPNHQDLPDDSTTQNPTSQNSTTNNILSAATSALEAMSLSKDKKANAAEENHESKSTTEHTANPANLHGPSENQAPEPEKQNDAKAPTQRDSPQTPLIPHKPSTTTSEYMNESTKIVAKATIERKTLCEGDTEIIENVLPEEAAQNIFERVRDEVRWQTMSHLGGEVPRLIAVQGELGEDGSIPVYRHPSDESPPLLPYTNAVSEIRAEVEKVLGHKLNHCLIQVYRDGSDYISEHSDKTLDIDPNSFIANVSLGATRTMTFRTKRPYNPNRSSGEAPQPFTRKTERVPLPHNSLCKMGLATNAKWLHSIRADKRRLAEKSENELSFDGMRISLTFRLITTYLTSDLAHIYGQGSTAKDSSSPAPILNGVEESEKGEAMIHAFGIENQSSDFDWAATYGKGFDILHMTNSVKLYLSSNEVANVKIRLMLHEYNTPYVISSASPPFLYKGGASRTDAPIVPSDLPLRFVDNNIERSAVEGDVAIAFYIETFYGLGPDREAVTRRDIAREFSRMQAAVELQKLWRAEQFSVKPFRKQLSVWNGYAREREDGFMAGSRPSLADFAFWPLLREILKEWGWDGIGEDLTALKPYFERMVKREPVVKLLEELEAEEKEKEREKGKAKEKEKLHD